MSANYYAVQVRAGKALTVDSRDQVNAIAKDLAINPVIIRAGGIATERDTLLTGDSRFTTHSVIHRFVRGFLFGRPGLDKDTAGQTVTDPLAKVKLWHYIEALAMLLPWFAEDRDSYLTRASVVFSALGVVGHDLMQLNISDEERMARISRLGDLDWRRTNLAWVGVAGTEKNGMVQPASSRPAIDATIRYLREVVGLINRNPQ